LVASQIPTDYDEVKVSLLKQTMTFYKPLGATKTPGIAAALSITAQKTQRRTTKTIARQA
jgi:hypothetical protein